MATVKNENGGVILAFFYGFSTDLTLSYNHCRLPRVRNQIRAIFEVQRRVDSL
jgi:hypothetical protein